LSSFAHLAIFAAPVIHQVTPTKTVQYLSSKEWF